MHLTHPKETPGEETVATVANHKSHLGSRRLRDADTHETILVPTPSADPNDPLNWSNGFKYYLAVLACCGVFLNTFLAGGPAIAIVGMTITYFGRPGRDFSHNVAKVAFFITTMPLMQGLAELIWMPFIVKYGRRPIYIISFVFYTLTSVWAGVATSYSSMLTARIFMGIASGAGECLGPLTITDIFFLHQRGRMMALYTAAITCGAAAGLIVGGAITVSHSWRYIFHVSTAIIGFVTLLYIFTMPETLYNRVTPIAQQAVTNITLKDGTSAHLEAFEVESPVIPRKKSYLRSLRIFSGKYTSESFPKLFFRPIALLILPPVFWAALVESVTIGFYIAITSNIAVAFRSTYHFANWQIGLCAFSPITGALLAIAAGGILSDKVADFFTLRNNGIREPEMRLPAVAINVLLAPLGLILYGVGIQNKLHWMVPTVGVGLLNFALVQSSNIALVYTIDAYRPVGGEVVVSQYVFKSAFGFLLSFYTYPWIERSGYTGAFGAMAGITGAVLLMGIPLYFYGKRIRLASLRWGPMKFVQWDEDRETGE